MPRGVYIHKKGRKITWGDKISEALKGHTFSKEHKLQLSECHKGYVMPEAQKEKIRKSCLGKNKGKKISEEHKNVLRNINKGRQLSEETKRKIGNKSRGRHHTKEAKEKIRRFTTGRKRPELTGDKNPMHTHPNSYKSKFGKCGYRQDIGIFVRSRWEANVYRIYKYLGYKIEYEPKSFKLSDGRTYRPDFYIKELNLWIEVKGCWLKDAKSRFDLFQLDYPEINIQVIDPLKYKNYYKHTQVK